MRIVAYVQQCWPGAHAQQLPCKFQLHFNHCVPARLEGFDLFADARWSCLLGFSQEALWSVKPLRPAGLPAGAEEGRFGGSGLEGFTAVCSQKSRRLSGCGQP